MEADSTTYEDNSKGFIKDVLPFPASPGNLKLYMNFTQNSNAKHLEIQIVEKLQAFGLLPKTIKCQTGNPECRLICKTARVVDRVQWSCEGCGKRQPIRSGSFFLRLQCSLLQALQIILAWCEDADCSLVAEHLGVKPKVVSLIYDKLDDCAIKEHKNTKLGGENSVVLAEIYPDCLNRLSPDTTDQPHVHRILMLADTKHIPTAYKLHVVHDLKKQQALDNQFLQVEVEQFMSNSTEPESTLVIGNDVPLVEGAVPIQQLTQQCDIEMQHFCTTWMQEMVWLVANNFDYAGAEKQLVTRFPFVEVGLYLEGSNNQAPLTPEVMNDPLMVTLVNSFDYVSSHPSPRFIKSHMPLSLLPPALLDTCRVVYVARDPRDVAVSYFYHYKFFKFMRYTGDFKQYWNFFTKDMLDCTPYFGNLKEAWEKRDHPNLLFLFYEDAVKDLPSVVKRVAKFLGKTVTEEQISRVCEHLAFDNFKKNKAVNMEFIQSYYTIEPNTSFIRKGKAGGWRDMFDDEMAQQAERWIADNLRDTDLRFPTVS